MKKINIAIDGHSSCGKSTLAKIIAEKFNYIYIDTGAMYRAVALYFMQNNILQNGIIDISKVHKALDDINVSFTFNNQTNKSETILNGKNVEEEIRGMQVSENVSKVSQLKEVRTKLVSLQQNLGKEKGVVMDGRDIGTVVFPNAELKIFLTALPEIRIERRYKELIAKGVEVSKEDVRKNINERDFNDQNRSENPLKKADDAIVIDNSNLSIEQQNNMAIALVQEKLLKVQV